MQVVVAEIVAYVVVYVAVEVVVPTATFNVIVVIFVVQVRHRQAGSSNSGRISQEKKKDIKIPHIFSPHATAPGRFSRTTFVLCLAEAALFITSSSPCMRSSSPFI